MFMGGTAGLVGAGESIVGATIMIGAGVAGGVSIVLGNSTAGHIISSAAGGISANQGQRLGGRRGRNRLVPEMQQSRDSTTGETLTWQVPPEKPQSSMLNRAVQNLRNRAQNISDTVQNIRQQITGRITNARRGRYARLSTNEPIEQHEPAPAQ